MEITKYSEVFARMAVDYSRTSARRRKHRLPEQSGPSWRQPQPQDERAIRAAMEEAIERRLARRSES